MINYINRVKLVPSLPLEFRLIRRAGEKVGSGEADLFLLQRADFTA